MKALNAPFGNSKVLILFLLIVLVTQSCRKDEEEEYTYRYISEHEQVNSLTKPMITNIYSAGAFQEPSLLDLKESIRYSIDVYKISYISSFQGSERNASGLICVPNSSGTFPIISFQNGTNTAHASAPSRAYSSPTFTVLTSLASQGYIMLIPDYFGFGAASDLLHPYYDKESSNQAVLDMLRAAHEFLDHYEGDATYSNTLYLMGYSQGAWATASVLETIEHNKLSYVVKAASCGSGAYSLQAMAEYILPRDSFSSPLYLPYFIHSQNENNLLDASLDQYFQPEYAASIPSLFDGSMGNDAVNAELTQSIPELLTTNFINNFKSASEFQGLRDIMQQNSLEAFTSQVSLRIYHGDMDEKVPMHESQIFYETFIARNGSSSATFIPLSGLNHTSGVTPWGVATLLWFNELEGY